MKVYLKEKLGADSEENEEELIDRLRKTQQQSY